VETGAMGCDVESRQDVWMLEIGAHEMEKGFIN
jgi:hypothetical protein